MTAIAYGAFMARCLVGRVDVLERMALDLLCNHECAGLGECVCDDGWPLFSLKPGDVQAARALFRRLYPDRALPKTADRR